MSLAKQFKRIEKDWPIGAQVRALVLNAAEEHDDLVHTWQQGEIESVQIHRDLNESGAISDVTFMVRRADGVEFAASFQTAERAVTIEWRWINSPHQCSLELQGQRGNGPVALGVINLPWDNEHYIGIPLRCERGVYWVDDFRTPIYIVRDEDNQIVGHVDASVVHFAADVPHEPAHAAR